MIESAAKNSAKLAQIWNGIYDRCKQQMPSIGQHYSVKACKDKQTNQKRLYKQVKALGSGEARPAWANTKLWTVCEDVYGGDSDVDVTDFIDDDGEVANPSEPLAAGNVLSLLCFDQLM